MEVNSEIKSANDLAVRDDDKNASAEVKSSLDPMARMWHPSKDRSREDQRSLYMTFSKGCPLTSSEISAYFRRKYGEHSVESVYVDQDQTKQSMFGVVRFSASYLPVAILHEHNGDGKISRHYIGGRGVVFKMYDEGLRTRSTRFPPKFRV